MEFIDIYKELSDLFEDVSDEYRKPRSDKPYEFAYLQGKKDGIRICLALLAELLDNKKESAMWKLLQESSNKGVATEREILRKQIHNVYKLLNDYIVFNGNYPEFMDYAKELIEWIDRTTIDSIK